MAVAVPVASANPAGVTADGSFRTAYNAAAIGAASNEKIVLVAIGKEVATVVVISVTIDDGSGSGVRTMDLVSGNTFGSMGAWIYRAAVAIASTAADIVVTWSGAITSVQNHIAVYPVTDAAGPPLFSGNNTSTDMDVTAPLTTGSTTIPVNGGMLAVAVGATDTVAKTWANLTVDLDIDAGDFRFTTAKSTTAGTATRTCTGTTNNEDGVMAWAGFAEALLPWDAIVPVTPPKAIKAAPVAVLLQQAALSELVMPPYRPR